jgi:sugar phosphate permease
VFLTPMQAELGWSRADLTGAFSMALLLSGLAGIPVGRWLDRHGPRLLMTLGSCVASLLVLAWAEVERLTTFYLIWGGLGVTLAAVLYEPAFFVVAAWFVRQRGRALTVFNSSLDLPASFTCQWPAGSSSARDDAVLCAPWRWAWPWARFRSMPSCSDDVPKIWA